MSIKEEVTMNLTIRRATPGDAPECGRICYEAFKSISDNHNFPPDFPSAEVAAGMMSFMLARTDVYSIVAEMDGRIVGSNILWDNDTIAGVGPVTVDPTVQNSAAGRRMMENILAHRSEER